MAGPFVLRILLAGNTLLHAGQACILFYAVLSGKEFAEAID